MLRTAIPCLVAIAALAASSAAFTASASDAKKAPAAPVVSTTAKAPTGIDVKGCTYRRPGNDTDQVCDPYAIAEVRKDGLLVNPYPSPFGSGSGGGL